NRLRFTEISQLAPDGRSRITSRPSIAMNATEFSIECGKSRTRCASSSRSRTGQHDGFKQSLHTFSRGNFSLSSTTVRNPARAQNAAQLDPAGPPPMIATSKSILIRCWLVMWSETRHLSFLKSEIPHLAGNDKGGSVEPRVCDWRTI